MLARELGEHHTVSICYPVIPDLEFLARCSRPMRSLGYARKYFSDCRNYFRNPRWRYGPLLDGASVAVRSYWSTIPADLCATNDVLVYFTPYQALELARLDVSNCTRVFYVMHDQSLTDAHCMDPELVRGTYRNRDHKIALSWMTQRCLSEFGVDCDDVIPGGVDTTVFCPRLPSTHSTIRLLAYYSPGEPRKGGAILLEVLESLCSRYPKASISLLVPRGVRVSGYQTFSALDDTSLAEIYREHDIFVYPSLHEGFGLPPLEAMASGCGVVATKVGSAEDYAVHDHSALLCDPGDTGQLAHAIERLMKSPELLSMLKANAAKQAREWSWANAGRKMRAYLETIVPEKNRSVSFHGQLC